MPSVEVIIPWRGGCPHRQRAFNWCARRAPDRRYPWPITVATGPTPWCKATAVMPAVWTSTADVLVIADADVWTEGIPAAVAAVEGGAGWAIPHHTVHRLTAEATAAYLAGADPVELPLERKVYVGVAGGGYVVARRETLLDCPLDPRFTGWGQEDECLGFALETMYGEAWRPDSDAALWHCWHPPAPRISPARGSRESWALRRRYCYARRDRAVMTELLREANDAFTDHLHPLHAHPQLAG